MSAPAQHLLTVTDTEGVAHLVTEQSLTAGHRAGRYLARCDQWVLPASLTTPERRRCTHCARRRRAR